MLAPFKDEGWEIWACSPPNYDLPRVDAWFELHNLQRKFSMPQNRPWVDVLRSHPRVYIAVPDPLLPNGIIFPIDPLVEKYGKYFWTSSIAYMMAFAIEHKPEKIGLWGVDMSATEEYGFQRAGCHFFIREAEKVGIPIVAPVQSDILNHAPMYGYKEQSPMWWKQKARIEELKSRLANAEQQQRKGEMEAYVFRGAIDDLIYTGNTYCPTEYEKTKQLPIVVVPPEEPKKKKAKKKDV